MGTPKKIDDFFDSDDDEFGRMQKEWAKVDDGMTNAGVRDGLESSQDLVLQEGFNTAFSGALKMAMAAGQLQGSISALLSCPSLQVKPGSEDGKRSTPETQHETQLQHLLTNNTELMAGIPRIVQSDTVKNIASSLGKHVSPTDASIDHGNISSRITQHKGSTGTQLHTSCGVAEETQSTEHKNVISCEDMCSNKAHFWAQLESFKVQGTALGVFSSND